MQTRIENTYNLEQAIKRNLVYVGENLLALSDSAPERCLKRIGLMLELSDAALANLDKRFGEDEISSAWRVMKVIQGDLLQLDRFLPVPRSARLAHLGDTLWAHVSALLRDLGAARD